MDITINTDDANHPHLALAGRFDAFETEAFGAIIDEQLAGSDNQISVNQISIDLGGVQFIDSSALAELVRAMKHCREAGGELFLRKLSDPVRVILELTRLDAAFEIVED